MRRKSGAISVSFLGYFWLNFNPFDHHRILTSFFFVCFLARYRALRKSIYVRYFLSQIKTHISGQGCLIQIDEKEPLAKADTKCQDFVESKVLGFAQDDQKRLT